MTICDICKKQGVHYEDYATINEDGGTTNLELCRSCYMKFKQNKNHHGYLAYKETIEEVTGETLKKKSWLDKLIEKF